MAKLNGFAVLAHIGSSTPTKVPLQTESSLNLTANTEEVTTKDSPKSADGKVIYPENEVTTVTAELSVTCYKEDTTKLGIKCGDAVKWKFISGADEYSGDGLVISLQNSGSVNGKATVQVSVQSTGEVTQPE